MTTVPAKRNPVGSRVTRAVQTLTPGYFAHTMASGIISVGLELEGFGAPSYVGPAGSVSVGARQPLS
ncbi:hypothetical protein [Arthrobacter sp. KBS0702]|uniref:hypothetical protein n=1 Tax=Arthrobacter sp. KBS0702 TaxID=2578107 RepID=UPI001643E280|nr:hypothetical protein [Arthrobacter sp. KBS0702]